MLANISFEGLFKASPSPYLILMPDAPRYTIAAVNYAYLLATGTREADLVGKGIFEAFPDNPNDKEANGERNLRASLEYVVSSHEPHSMGIQKYDIPVRGTGEFELKYWAPVNSPILNDDGRLELIFHQVTDVTRQVLLEENDKVTRRVLARQEERYRRAAEAVKTSEERYRNLFENNPLPMWVYHPETFAFLEVNQSAVDKYGYSYAEFLKMTIFDIRPPEDIDRVKAVVGTRRVFGKPYAGAFRHLKKNGELIYVEITAKLIHHAGGHAVLILANDITEKVQTEEAIQKSEELRERITNSVEEQNSKLREIAWLQSHMVRAPLTRIMGLVEIMRNYASKEEALELLGTLLASADELDAVIKTIVKEAEEVDKGEPDEFPQD